MSLWLIGHRCLLILILQGGRAQKSANMAETVIRIAAAEPTGSMSLLGFVFHCHLGKFQAGIHLNFSVFQ